MTVSSRRRFLLCAQDEPALRTIDFTQPPQWTPELVARRLQSFPPHRLIPYGRAGVPGTIEKMREAALGRRGEQHLGLLQLTHSIVRGVRAKDYGGEAAAIFYWHCRNGRYVRDPVHVELVRDPVAFVESGMHGDCDDSATCIAAQCMQVGCPARFVTVGFQRTPKPLFTHVFCEAWISRANQWVTLDPVAGPLTPAMRRQIVWRRNYPIDRDMGRVETLALRVPSTRRVAA